MRFVIMADGKGERWNNYSGIPKHLAQIDGEPVIGRTVRFLREIATEENEEMEIIITSHDERYEFEGARRHEPENNHYEIDRFTEELVQDRMCFLYGDTIYDKETLKNIVHEKVEEILFYGNSKSVIAVIIGNAKLFREHFDRVKKLYLDGQISKCKGWQIYQSVTGQNLNEKPVAKEKFVRVDENVTDINTPEEYEGRKQ